MINLFLFPCKIERFLVQLLYKFSRINKTQKTTPIGSGTMLFNSLSYAIFLPVVFCVYWVLPHKWRWVLLLTASYYFYMSWNPKYIILILGTTIISYLAAIVLEKTCSPQRKKLILLVTAIICLGVLFIFKYFNFALDSVCKVLNIFSINWTPGVMQLLLPVGISFYSFQTLSYVIDVYRERIPAEKHLGYYATFISFFPQLVAGPIERTSNLLPQIKNKKVFREEQAFDGIKLMIWGYFKKMVIADLVGKYVDMIYADLYSHEGFALAIVIFFFTIQIYCDFSGYSSIAIGSAKLMGINLMDNFKSPYCSASIKEFWSRWHISLSTWFRDYVYIPLGGNRCGKIRHSINLMVTFITSGLWHGANWTFVVWGGMHGLAQIVENIFVERLNKMKKYKIGKFTSWLIIFLFCNFAWVFFRADSIAGAFYVITHFTSGIMAPIDYLREGFAVLDISILRLCYICVMLLILFIVDGLSYKKSVLERLKAKKGWVQWIIYMALSLLVILFAQKGEAAEFVYFQF